MQKVVVFVVVLLMLAIPAMAGDAAGGGEPREVVAGTDGALIFRADDAVIVGQTLKVSTDTEGSYLSWWQEQSDYPRWRVRLDKPGKYTLKLTYSCAPHSAGAKFSLLFGKAPIARTIQSTGSWETWQTMTLATLDIRSAGSFPITLKAIEKPQEAVMNLRQISLEPVR